MLGYDSNEISQYGMYAAFNTQADRHTGRQSELKAWSSQKTYYKLIKEIIQIIWVYKRLDNITISYKLNGLYSVKLFLRIMKLGFDCYEDLSHPCI